MVKTIFKAKTLEGFYFKILVEILHNNFKNTSLKINKKGIFVTMFDKEKTRLINICLNSDKFNIYKFNYDEEEKIMGINLDNLNKMVKSIKKNDSITLYMRDDDIDKLIICIETKENRSKKSEVKINVFSQENICPEIPTDYYNTINIESVDFQKVCKELAGISSIINISSQNFSIVFAADDSGIFSRKTTLGITEDSDDDDDDNDDDNRVYSEDFFSNSLVRITKIASLSNKMQICISETDPIMFKSNIGSIGCIQIFVKSKKEIERDSK